MERSSGRQDGVTLGLMLGKETGRSFSINRTLLDIIRQEEPNCRVYENCIGSSNKGWKSKDKCPLRRNLDGNMWAGGVPVRLSDVSFRDDVVSTSNVMVMGAGSGSNQRPALAHLLRSCSVHVVEQVQEDDDSGEVPWAATGEVQSLNQYLSRVGSSRENPSRIEHFPVSNASGPNVSNRSSTLTRNVSRIPSTSQLDRPVNTVRLSEALAAEREHMQTVISATEAARDAQNETQVTETNNNEEQVQTTDEVANEQPQVRMSLMDLLEDTNSRQIGWSSYSGDVEYYTGNIDEESEYPEEYEGSNFVEQTCCVCMVRHKGSAFIPCGHTFCRLCSRKLWVNRGNCPICNGFILEILDIF